VAGVPEAIVWLCGCVVTVAVIAKGVTVIMAVIESVLPPTFATRTQ
jgi:hypothetical protein